MAIFNSYVSLPEGIANILGFLMALFQTVNVLSNVECREHGETIIKKTFFVFRIHEMLRLLSC